MVGLLILNLVYRGRGYLAGLLILTLVYRGVPGWFTNINPSVQGGRGLNWFNNINPSVHGGRGPNWFTNKNPRVQGGWGYLVGLLRLTLVYRGGVPG